MSGKCNLLLLITYYPLPNLVWKTVPPTERSIRLIRLIRLIRVRLIPQWVFEHGFYGLTRMLIEVMVLSSRQFFLLLVIIPRLRPGLLSLRSVLSSRQLSFCARSPSALSPRSKSITDNADATDLFFSRIFLFGLFFYLDLYAPVGRWDLHGFTLVCGLLLLYAIQRRTGANTIRRKSKTK